MTRQADMYPNDFTDNFEELRRHWLEKMTGFQASRSPRTIPQPPPGLDRLTNKSINVPSPEATYRPRELEPNAGIDETSTTLATLTIMLAYKNPLVWEQPASSNAAPGYIHAITRSGNTALIET